MENLETLAPILGEEKAKQLLGLLGQYDLYMQAFKVMVNSLLEEQGLEVKVGVAFVQKEQSNFEE